MINYLYFTKTEDTFNVLSECTQRFDKKRALIGLRMKLKSEEDYTKFCLEIDERILKAKNILEHVKTLQRKYNREFPSEDKNCLTTPHLFYNKSRNTICFVRDSIKSFCPKRYKAPGTYTTNTYTTNNSYFCGKIPYMPELLPDTYPDYVNNVLDRLGEFYELSSQIIMICKDVIDEENAIRNDDEYLEQIDLACQKEHRDFAIKLRDEGMLNENALSPDEYKKIAAEATSIKVFRREYFHNISPEQYKIRIFKNIIMEGINRGLSAEESRIWRNQEDYDFVKEKVRPAIKAMCARNDLPLIKVKNSTDTQIKADYIACFMEWCRVCKSHYRDFVDYLGNMLADAPFLIPKYTSITAALSRLTAKKKKEYISDFESY